MMVPLCSTIRGEAETSENLGSAISPPVSANIAWRDTEGRFNKFGFNALGAEISESEGSRVEVFLFDEVRGFDRPHP